MSQFELQGELTYNTVMGQREGLLHAITNATSGTLTVSLSQLKKIDTAGLSLLVEAAKHAANQSRYLSFVDFPEQFKAILKFCLLDDILNLTQE